MTKRALMVSLDAGMAANLKRKDRFVDQSFSWRCASGSRCRASAQLAILKIRRSQTAATEESKRLSDPAWPSTTPGSAGGSPAGDGVLAIANFHRVRCDTALLLSQRSGGLFGRAAQTSRRAACAPRKHGRFRRGILTSDCSFAGVHYFAACA